MLDKEIINLNILKNKKFVLRIAQPQNKLSINFLSDFSNELRKFKKINIYPDLVYLIFWCMNKKKNLLKYNKENNLRVGRGIIFHICPSNVPTNFVYSFFFGLLSGNSNIIKVPSKNFKEKDIILSVIKKLFNKKKYLCLRDSNLFISYENKNESTTKISSICDGRVIWGGDKTVNDIRKVWIPERAVEITFPDRYSFCLINLKTLNKLNTTQMQDITKKFYYDSYMMNQLACNSPHFTFWIGKKNNKLQNKFWFNLSKIVEKKFIFDDVHVVDKYTNLLENIIIQKNFKKIKMIKNNVYVLNPNKQINKIENIRGVNGTFFQKNINQLKDLKKYITKKCQTITYYGFEKNEFKDLLTKNNLLGVDRVVPIGKALEIDTIWDGYDVIKSLSRIIVLD